MANPKLDEIPTGKIVAEIAKAAAFKDWDTVRALEEEAVRRFEPIDTERKRHAEE